MADSAVGRTMSTTVGRPDRPAVLRVVADVIAAARHLWLLVVLLAVWEAVGRIGSSVFLPPFSAVARRFVDLWFTADPAHLFLSHLFWVQAGASLSRFAQGWGLSVVVGVGFGVLLATHPILNRMYSPVVRFFAALPNTLLLPIAVQIFGVADSMNIFLIFLGSVWVIIINTADGVAGVDPMWLRSARSMKVSTTTLYRSVILPAASPLIFAGLRVGLGIGLILMVISELYATTKGVGYQIVAAQARFRYIDMWSAFVLIGCIGILLNFLLSAIESYLLRWHTQPRTGA